MPVSRRHAMQGLMLALALPAAAGRARAAVPATGPALIMVDRAGCSFCAAWRREILPGYAAHPLGRALPLTIVALDGPWPDGLVLDRAPRITPSFLLLRDRVEVSRLEGYPGARHFWSALAEVMNAGGGGA